MSASPSTLGSSILAESILHKDGGVQFTAFSARKAHRRVESIRRALKTLEEGLHVSDRPHALQGLGQVSNSVGGDHEFCSDSRDQAASS